MINNEYEDYIVVHKDLYNEFGFSKSLILQFLANFGGEYVGSIGSILKTICVISKTNLRDSLTCLSKDGIIKIENISGWTKRYTILRKDILNYKIDDYIKKKEFKIKDSLPEAVKYRLRKIQEIREEKMKNSL